MLLYRKSQVINEFPRSMQTVDLTILRNNKVYSYFFGMIFKSLFSGSLLGARVKTKALPQEEAKLHLNTTRVTLPDSGCYFTASPSTRSLQPDSSYLGWLMA